MGGRARYRADRSRTSHNRSSGSKPPNDPRNSPRGSRAWQTSVLMVALRSRLQSHAAQQVGEARVAVERLEAWKPSGSCQQATASLKVLFQPGKSLILVSQTRVQGGDILAERFMPFISCFQV